MRIRPEQAPDHKAIGALIRAAFATVPYSSGTEGEIVDALRRAGALTLSLIAEEGPDLLGHVAFSPVLIGGEVRSWFGLGPVAVRLDQQRKGIGRALIESGLSHLRTQGARGCVVLGDPAYYRRFGFESDPALRSADTPAELFQRLSFAGDRASGLVTNHEAFSAS
jgi:putative acetyltransferase